MRPTRPSDTRHPAGKGKVASGPGGKPDDPAGSHISEPLHESLEENVKRLKDICGQKNADIIIRQVKLRTEPEIDIAIFYTEGLTDRTTINLAILQPLMLISRLSAGHVKYTSPENAVQFVKTHLVPASPVTEVKLLGELIDHVMTGETGILVDGAKRALCVETKTWEHRGISEPSSESVIRGPREGFNEILRSNTALIRRRIRSPRLRIEPLKLGELSVTDMALCWIEGITNPDLIKIVRERLKGIKTDIIPDSGYIEQFIEDQPFSPFPQFQYTERPDRVAAALAEGRLALIVDGSPMVLLLPGSFTAYLNTPEDYYERVPYGSLLRLMRLGATIIALTLPGFYIALTTFHHEMLPTSLLMAFTASHEPVPFPALVEALLLILALELVREAGLRLPTPVGQTVGIVAALLLGQAAVQAGLASPILVIVVAITGLSSFVVPHWASGLPLRWLAFPLMILAGTLGLFGLTAGVVAIVLHLAGLTSLGVPYLEPMWRTGYVYRDTFVRMPLWSMVKRPGYLRPLDQVRQEVVVRQWADPDHEGGDKT